MGSEDGNFKVVIRVRPPIAREIDSDKQYQSAVRVETNNRVISISENAQYDAEDSGFAPYATHVFTFDHVFDQDTDQRSVYETSAKTAVKSALEGYNATMIAYGQTGTGKTYTMEGDQSHRGRTDEQRGIIPRSIEDIFKYIETCQNPRMKFLVRASYLQIYNEVISDLLKPDRSNLAIREDRRKGVFVEGLSEWVVRTPSEIYGLMQRGAAMRATGSTKLNEISSRSHAVFIIIAEQSELVLVNSDDEPVEAPEDIENLDAVRLAQGVQMKQVFRVGKLNLVDLAGSERVRHSGATGRRLEETKKINQSLSALGNVIAALTDTKGRQHVPYRDSKLTRILEDSLGGNCKTTMMAMISPALEAFVESLSTLKFANRAKNIKNEARVNEDLDQKTLLRKYERELKRLRQELAERSRTVVDKRKVLELEDQRRQAEQDKLAAISELETQARDLRREKEEKRKLENRIQQMQSQLLTGGVPIEDSHAFRNAVMQEHVRMHADYEAKVQELERERQSIEEDKAQVDRYKQLLLKQRDIMIALTARLNERDESILALQEELDAYDRHQRMMEDALDQKTASLIHLQRATMENSPGGGSITSSMTFPPGSLSARAVADASDRKQYAPFGGSETVLFANGEGASGAPPGSARMLTADEKVSELSQLLEQRASEQSQLQQELEEVQAEKVSLEYLLREKLEKMVQSEIEERLSAYRKETDQRKWTSLSGGGPEDKRRLADAVMELTKVSGNVSEFQGRLATVIQREAEIVQRSYTDTVARLKAELQRAKEEKEQATRETERLGRDRGGGEDATVASLPRRGSFNRSKVEELRESKQNGIGNGYSSNNEDVEAANARARMLEGKVDGLKQQHSQFRDDMAVRLQRLEEENQRLRSQLTLVSPMPNSLTSVQSAPRASSSPAESQDSLAADADEVLGLRQQCAVYHKERSALKTIMENKMKVLVDSIAAGMDSDGGDAVGGGGGLDRVVRDVRMLQKLVNASIAAIKNSGSENMHHNNSNNNNRSTSAPPPTIAPSSSSSISAPGSANPPDLDGARRREQVLDLIKERRLNLQQNYTYMNGKGGR
mmetsp:Transcript_3747/g.5684  ORF Transcript_3747/g.5684 Transcript_3747/m.5684 type:complete len:1075 (+) Transcript_3747:68-3292(+)